MARAIYSEADIYLLDDPLSAVDPEVASAIFNECITDHLKDKIVVLVTHQLQFITNCEKILLLSNKKQKICAPYATIQAEGMDIEAILKEYTSMMKRTKTALSLKSFKSETSDNAAATDQSNKAKPSAAARRKGLAMIKGHSIYMQPTQAAPAKKQDNLIVAEEKISGKVGFKDY